MQKVTVFFWHCSGADLELLKRCPTEASKYVGIGATIFFTGLFAALSGGYALYTVFDSYLIAGVFGILWGLMIFNLDRYIVSSMRKEGKPFREFALAIPRIVLAVLISIVIAKPLELKIFDKEIQPELTVMEQESFARQEEQLRARFTPKLDSLGNEILALKQELLSKATKRDELKRLAQEEADGTGGSRQRNLGPIYKVKKMDADAAEAELLQLTIQNQARITELESSVRTTDSTMASQLQALDKSKINGLAARIQALNRITENSNAVTWAHWFIILLFIAIETAPVFVKLISGKGPYDNLLRIAEHRFTAEEIELMAETNSQTKVRSENMSAYEKDFVTNSLDARLKYEQQ